MMKQALSLAMLAGIAATHASAAYVEGCGIGVNCNSGADYCLVGSSDGQGGVSRVDRASGLRLQKSIIQKC